MISTLSGIFLIALLWSIARSMKRIERRIAALKVVIDIPIYGDDGGGQPVELPKTGNVVAFKRAK